MILLDTLRPPSLIDPTASRYKDWLHLIVLHHPSGTVGLINVSLHGPPNDPRSRAVGTALVHAPNVGWLGNVEIHSFAEANLGQSSIGLRQVAMAVDHVSGTLLASVIDPENGLNLSLNATAFAPPVVVEQLPLGGGWISWHAVPRLTVSGKFTVGNRDIDLQEASAYHDHNWGRWHWGEDLGWEWGCFMTPGRGPALILSRTTDRAHHRHSNPSLVIEFDGRRRAFGGSAVVIDYRGELQTTLRRVPGALAALHQDRAHVRLPKRLHFKADDGFDHLEAEFTAEAAAQLIAADPLVRGYSFIHEISGTFSCNGMISGNRIMGSGLGVLEYVC